MASHSDGHSSLRTRRNSTSANSSDAILVIFGCSDRHAKHHPAKYSTHTTSGFPELSELPRAIAFASSILAAYSSAERTSATFARSELCAHRGRDRAAGGKAHELRVARRFTLIVVETRRRAPPFITLLSFSVPRFWSLVPASFAGSVERDRWSTLDPTAAPAEVMANARWMVRRRASPRAQGLERDDDACVARASAWSSARGPKARGTTHHRFCTEPAA